MTTDIPIQFLNDAVDFVKLAEAMGAKAIRITKMEEVEPAFKEALACPRTVSYLTV